MGGNPTLEIDKGERPQFPYKMGSLPLGWEKKKERETMGLPTKEWEALMVLN